MKTEQPSRRAILLVLLAGTTLSGAGLAQTPSSKPSKGSHAGAVKAFDTIQRVLQHPRCQNCHIPGDAPLQRDLSLVHDQNVKRGPDGRGVPGQPCSSCHGEANLPDSYGPAQPPGAPNWHLPPADQKMVFIGLSKAQLCATIKNKATNGGKDLAETVKHLDSDPLVLWGWKPGFGRAPVDVPHEELMIAVRTWSDGGAPCPAVTKAE